MTGQPARADFTRVTLNATIRAQLHEAWQRGMGAPPHDARGDDPAAAITAFGVISNAIDNYVTTLLADVVEQHVGAALKPGVAYDGSVPGSHIGPPPDTSAGKK